MGPPIQALAAIAAASKQTLICAVDCGVKKGAHEAVTVGRVCNMLLVNSVLLLLLLLLLFAH
jgi:hypothetical protein